MTKLFKLSIFFSLAFTGLINFLNAEPFESTYTPLPSQNILIKNANIYDGEGNELLKTNLLIKDRKIAAIGGSIHFEQYITVFTTINRQFSTAKKSRHTA